MRETLTISFPKYLADGSVTCFPLHCIISSVNGVNGVFYQNEIGHTGHNMFQNVSKDTTTETTDMLSTNVQEDWKHSTQGNCKAFTGLIKMSNTYTRTLSKVKVS